MSLLNVARVPAVVVAPTATVLDAIRVMDEEKVGAVAVVRDDKLVGIFTERDVMTRIVLAARDAKSTPVAEVMTNDPQSVGQSTGVKDALRVMIERHFRHLPVVDAGGRVLGMLSMRHVLRVRVDVLTNELDSVAGYLGADGPGG
jgi:CBS domain-containing protein